MAILNTTWVKRKINNVLTKTFAIAHIKSTYYDYSKGKTLDDVLIETEDFDQTAVQESEISPVILSKINAIANQTSNNFTLLNENKAEKTEIYSATEVDQIVEPMEESIQNLDDTTSIKTVTGKSLALKTSDGGIGLNKILGESAQSQEPSPSSPQTIVSAGDSGSIVVDSNNINLINPTLETTTKNGVTCTKTDDGRYILNGTATGNVFFNVATKIKAVKGKTYRLCGIKDTVDISLTARDWSDASKSYGYMDGNKLKLDFTNDSDYLFVYIYVRSGTTLSNVEVRPMLTLNLTATYDDFKKYHSSSIIIPLTEPLRGIGDVKDEIINRDGVWGVLRRFYSVSVPKSSYVNKNTYYECSTSEMQKVISSNGAGSGVGNQLCNVTTPQKMDNPDNKSGYLAWIYSWNYSTTSSRISNQLYDELNDDQILEFVYRRKDELFEPFEDQNPFYELESYADNTYINTDDGIADLSVFYSSGNTGAIALEAYNESKKTKVITTSENTVTEEGKYAVDATQLNPNVSGSLAKKVSDNTTKLSGIEAGANKYVHPTTSGNKHIPSGGAAGKILKWKSDGTAVWDFLSEIATYKFDNNGNAKKYIKLGTATIGNQGEYVYLEVFAGAGFNSNVKQIGSYKIYLRAGNGTAVNGKYYAGLVECHLTGNADHNVYVLQNSSTSLTVYIEAPSYMGNSFYTAMCSNKASWANQIEVLSTLPDGAALLERKKIAYTDSFSDATQSASGLMSASDKTKLDGIATGANKTTSTDIQNAMKSDGVQVGTTYTFSGNTIKSSTGVHLNANNGNNNVYAECTGLYAMNGDVSSYVPVYASAFTQVSSNRYKKNVQNMTDEDARKILSLRAVKYDYIEEKNGTNCYGFIAEEVNQLMRYPVIFNEKGVTEGLDYSKFVPYIIKLLQIQQKEIEDLKKKIIS